VLTDVRDRKGTTYRAVTLNDDGSLVLVGHDLGSEVQSFFGCREYEFERTLSASDAQALHRLLAVPVDVDVLTAIADRFPSGTGLEAFISEHDIASRFWSRVGD